ncbi:MAG: carbon-nitrogen hydrolase family protein [Paracoccaceae bacterium]
MNDILDIACLQTRPMPTFETAIEEAVGLARSATDADLLVLPEYCGGLKSEGARLAPPAAPSDDHPVVQAFQALARERGVWILIGSVAVTGPGDKVINRGFLLDSQGAVQATYDKIHMFDIQLSDTEVYRESASVAPGHHAVIHDTPWGKIGHTICYDLRFPGLYRALAQGGADMLMCPAAFTQKTGEAHWHVLNRARAIENTCFMISPCATGPVPGGGACYGHSLIVDPWGTVLADGGTDPGVVRAKIDLGAVAEARRKIPSLSHDRSFSFDVEPETTSEPEVV